MEKAVMIQLVVSALMALLPLERQVLAAGFNDSSIHGLAVDAESTHIMQVVRERRPQRFSYCLRTESVGPGQILGFLRFDDEVRSTTGMPHAQLLYNANHRADYGPYYVELVGVSVAGTVLEGINADTFRRDEATGKGGTVLDVGSRSAVVMTRAAYDILERAVEEHLRPIGLPHVSRHPLSFCLRGATKALWQHLPTVTLHFREPGAEVVLPPSKLFGQVGRDACMSVIPGDITVIGVAAQINMRFTFDLRSGAVFFAPENCKLDTGRKSAALDSSKN